MINVKHKRPDTWIFLRKENLENKSSSLKLTVQSETCVLNVYYFSHAKVCRMFFVYFSRRWIFYFILTE